MKLVLRKNNNRRCCFPEYNELFFNLVYKQQMVNEVLNFEKFKGV